MGTSGTESCEGCLLSQFKHLPPPPALKLSVECQNKYFLEWTSRSVNKSIIYSDFETNVSLLDSFDILFHNFYIFAKLYSPLGEICSSSTAMETVLQETNTE